jgi:hypothetical protein
MKPPDSDPSLPPTANTAGPDSLSTETQPSNLRQIEVFWSKHYKWLEDSGYLLRPRYSPGWVPSWQGTSKDPPACEDWIKPQVCVCTQIAIVDAYRISCSMLVY